MPAFSMSGESSLSLHSDYILLSVSLTGMEMIAEDRSLKSDTGLKVSGGKKKTPPSPWDLSVVSPHE